MALRLIVIGLLAGLWPAATAAQTSTLDDVMDDVKQVVKAGIGLEEERLAVVTTLGETQEGEVLPAGTGFEARFSSPEVLRNAPQGKTFEAKDVHSDAVFLGQVTTAKSWWRGPKIRLTELELGGSRHRIATKPVVFTGSESQVFTLLEDVQLERTWPWAAPLRAALALPFNRPFRGALIVHGVLALLACVFVCFKSKWGSWVGTKLPLRQRYFWVLFNIVSVLLLLLGTYFAGRHVYATPPVNLQWLAGGVCGLALGWALQQLVWLVVGVPFDSSGDSGPRVGPVEPKKSQRQQRRDDAGLSDDWSVRRAS